LRDRSRFVGQRHTGRVGGRFDSENQHEIELPDLCRLCGHDVCNRAGALGPLTCSEH
jgi:hypothetical protein